MKLNEFEVVNPSMPHGFNVALPVLYFCPGLKGSDEPQGEFLGATSSLKEQLSVLIPSVSDSALSITLWEPKLALKKATTSTSIRRLGLARFQVLRLASAWPNIR